MKLQVCRTVFALGGFIALLCGSSGCNAEAATYVGQREVSARSTTLNGASVYGGGQSAQLVVALRAFEVTERRLSWDTDGALALPERWTQLELVQSGRWVVVRLDGKTFHKIGPAA